MLYVLILWWFDKLFYLCFSDSENEFIFFVMVVMKIVGCVVVISDSLCFVDWWVFVDGDNGKFFLNVRFWFLLFVESFNNVIKIVEMFIYGF